VSSASAPEAVVSSPRIGPLEVVGEALLIGALVISPWFYGSVEESARYALCAVLFAASTLYLWPELRGGRLPRGAAAGAAFPAFALLQILAGRSVAPLLTAEAALVALAMFAVWMSIDARSGSTSTNSARRLALALLAVCVGEAMFGAFQWSTDKRALFGQRSELQTMPFGSYVNHNNFAGLVSLGVPLALAMSIGDTRRSGRLGPWGLALLGVSVGLGITVVASGSRGGTIAMAAGLIVFVWLFTVLNGRRPRGGLRKWPLIAGVVVAVLAVRAVPTPTLSRFALLLDSSGTFGYRAAIATASFDAWKERPFLGYGLGAFGDAAAPFKQGFGDVRSERAEADFIEIAVEGGLVLCLGFLAFGRFCWREARRTMERERSRSGRWLRAGALIGCGTMLVHSFFDFGFRIPANALAFSVLLGIATASLEPPPLRAAPWRGLLLCSFGAGIFLAVQLSAGASGERAALSRKTPESRLQALQPLVDRHPYLENARRQRAIAWMTLAYSKDGYEPTRLARARRDLESALRTRPQWGEAHADLAWVKYFEGRSDEARGEMAKAIQFDPTHLGIGLARAQLLAWSGDVSAAISELSRLRKRNPQWSREHAREVASSWTKDAALLAAIP